MKLSSTKHLKSLASLLLAAALVVGVCIPAWTSPNAAAADDPPTGGGATYSITINNAVSGETYTAYKLFEVTVNDTNTAYSYYIKKDNVALKNALGDMGLSFTESADGSQFLVNAEEVSTGTGDSAAKEVKFYKTDTSGTKTYMTAAQLAETINTQINTNNSTLKAALTSAGSATASIAEGATTASATIDVSTSGAGYYFVDSSLGALCALGTAANTVEINEKNTVPTITKKVASDLTDDTYQAYGDGDVIDTINYKLIVNTGSKTGITPTGTGVDEDYTIEDTLPTGISHNANSVVIKVNNTNWTTTTDYTVSVSDQVMTIVLKGDKVKTLDENTDIVITYTATMDKAAVHIDSAGNATGNTNTAKLKYQSQETSASAIVYTYQIGGTATAGNPIIQKVDGTDGANNAPLAGVKFILSKDVTTGTGDTATTTTYYAKVSNKTTGTAGSYYLTGWTSTKTDAGEIVTGENGGIEVLGLDAGTYILTEVETLPGYNLLNDTITVTITSSVDDTTKANTVTISYKMTKATGDATTSIAIENETGAELPSTGGIGTAIFYIVGGLLVVGAVVLLVLRRRSKNSR